MSEGPDAEPDITEVTQASGGDNDANDEGGWAEEVGRLPPVFHLVGDEGNTDGLEDDDVHDEQHEHDSGPVTLQDLILYMAPLALSVFTVDIVEQLGNMALTLATVDAVEEENGLAAWGIALGLIRLLASPLMETRQLGMVLASTANARRICLMCIAATGGIILFLLTVLASSTLGASLIEGAHHVDAAVSSGAVKMLWLLAPWPLLDAVAQFYSGVLLRKRHSVWVASAWGLSIIMQMIVMYALLPAVGVRVGSLTLPVVVVYVGSLARLTVISVACGGLTIPAIRRPTLRPAVVVPPVTVARVINFAWPLALVHASVTVSRVFINLFVARGSHGTTGLAVLTLVHPLGHMTYGWLMSLKTVPPAFKFRDVLEEGESEDRIKARLRDHDRVILRFTIICTCFAAFLASLFWLPFIRDYLLVVLAEADDKLAAKAATPMGIFPFFAPPAAVIAIYTGWASVEDRTRVLAPSGPMRIAGILLVLMVIVSAGGGGATLGVVAMLTGFTSEAVAVVAGYRCCARNDLEVERRRVAQIIRVHRNSEALRDAGMGSGSESGSDEEGVGHVMGGPPPTAWEEVLAFFKWPTQQRYFALGSVDGRGGGGGGSSGGSGSRRGRSSQMMESPRARLIARPGASRAGDEYDDDDGEGSGVPPPLSGRAAMGSPVAPGQVPELDDEPVAGEVISSAAGHTKRRGGQLYVNR